MSPNAPLWQPTEEHIRRTQMHAFMDQLADGFDVARDWESLRTWSIEHREDFWAEFLTFAGIKTHTPARCVFEGTGMLDGKWFPGMTLNYAEHMLRFDDERTAIHFECETGQPRKITYRALREQVIRFAAALRAIGVEKGDRVAGFMPNLPEALIAMLATASLGAVWSSCSPDFGINGVLDRFGQIEPKVLVAADGYTYNGKRIETLDRVQRILEKLTSARSVVIVPFIDESPDLTPLPMAQTWDDFLAQGDAAAPLTFEPVPFDHPLFIMYSSGTTGMPKCIVHGHGGTLIQHMKELMLHCDLRREDTIFYFTTCGWMMWNWLVSSLGVGATVVLYEGSPAYPRINRLWEMIARVPVTVFGTSPKYLSAVQKSELSPSDTFDLSRLRCILSTGSPLAANQFEWVYESVKTDLQLSSICGGTDIISCFMLGNPILPVYAGEIQCTGLGMDVRAFDASGEAVTGGKGELVCCAPFPSQPIYFWNDPDGQKYKNAYFKHYEGIWRHGDLIEITAHGGVVVHGRSDATLNPGGVRIGTAEIYRVVEAMPEIADSIVVAKRVDGDDEVCLFIVLQANHKLDDALAATIKKRIADSATKRHVPRHIKQVTAIPHTISGKKVELAVTQMIHNQPVANRDALANPETLDQFANIV